MKLNFLLNDIIPKNDHFCFNPSLQAKNDQI